MAHARATPPKSETVPFLSGIVLDVQMLIEQQMALFRHEMGQELDRAREAGCYLLAGVVLISTSTLLLSLMVAHLFAVLLPGLPLWACFGIVGLFLACLGGLVCRAAIRKFHRVEAAVTVPSVDLAEKHDG